MCVCVSGNVYMCTHYYFIKFLHSRMHIFTPFFLIVQVSCSDGFSYERKPMEQWIASCAAKGKALTSHKTSADLDPHFFPHLTLRTIVQEHIEAKQALYRRRQREKKKEGKMK